MSITAPQQAKNATTQQPIINLTDDGNARRIIKRHGNDMRFCKPWNQWLIWDGLRWKPDESFEVERRADETRDNLTKWVKNEMIKYEGNEDEITTYNQLQKVLNHCKEWESNHCQEAAIRQARHEPGIAILPQQLDQNPWLLNCKSGTIDLHTGNLLPHRRQDYMTKLAPVAFDPEAKCPTWLNFLERIMDGNQDMIGYLKRMIGYALTADVREQCLFFFHGEGRNGKSTFLGTVQAMLGDYAMQAVSDLLMKKAFEAHPTERADLLGKRLVATIETEEGKRLAEALVKQFTGGDPIRARKMRQDFFEFLPTHKIILAANHKPTIKGRDVAIWRRIKLVPFNVTIADEHVDKTLPDKLKAELPGILNWAIHGCLEWQQYGLGEPEEVKQATDEYRGEQDTLAAFIAECCYLGPDAKIRFADLYEAYKSWCKRTGEEEQTGRAVSKALRSRGFENYKNNGIWFKGIMLDNGTK